MEVQHRAIKSFFKISAQYQKQILSFIEEYKPTKVYITGSLASGMYMFEYDKEISEYRRKRGHFGVSDVDITVEPIMRPFKYKDLDIIPPFFEKYLIYDGQYH